MIELTLEQAQALHQESGSPSVFDPTTNTAYTLVPIEAHANGSPDLVPESVETLVEPVLMAAQSGKTVTGAGTMHIERENLYCLLAMLNTRLGEDLGKVHVALGQPDRGRWPV